jgi:hypothetical protein
MTFLDDAAWQGRVYSDGWVSPAGGQAAVTEPATGGQLGRTGIAAPADIARASSGQPLRSRRGLPCRIPSVRRSCGGPLISGWPMPGK